MNLNNKAGQGGMVETRDGFLGLGRFAAAILAGALFATPLAARGASFDCTKAASPTEKLICANDDLSRLDSILDSIYKGEHHARNTSGKKTLEREQGLWLRKVRDACKTRQCLRDAYYARLATLDQIDERYIKNWKYPPYPDVWGYEYPNKECENAITDIWFSENGDALVRYANCASSGINGFSTDKPRSVRPQVYGYRRFFAQKDHVIDADDYNNFREKFASPGSPVSPSRATTFRFRNGNVLNYVDGSECNEGPYARYYELKNQNGAMLWKKFVLVRSKPRQVMCIGSDEYQLSSDSNTSRLTFLLDGTFLMRIGNTVVRFDSNLNTRHPYDRKRIYIVDHKDVQAVIARAKKRCEPYEPCLDEEMNKYLDSLR